jgi:hypothetical protein
MRDHASFGYRIRETSEGWSWTTFDTSGRVEARGRAPTKAVAAALVIRAIARSAAPAQEAASAG